MSMAQPLLDFLTGRARTALPFLRAGVAQGLSSSAIIAALQGQGLSFARQRMLDVIAALQGRADINRYIRLAGETTPLPPEAHTVSVTNLRTNYQYVVRAENPVTEDEYYVTVVSAVPLSVVQIRALADSAFLGTGDSSIDREEYDRSIVTIEEANVDPSVG